MFTADLALLRAFAVFAGHRNLTRAARALHVSQPALHAQLARLAASLGVTLYRRAGRGLALTPDGERVAAFARDVTERCERFGHELHGAAPSRPLALCAGAGSYLHLLGDALRRWFAAPPHPLRLLTGDREATVDAVRGGEAQLGVAPLDGAVEGVRGDVLAVVPLVAALPAGSPLAARQRLRARDLGDVPLVLPTSERPHRQRVEAALRAAGASPHIAAEANGWELALRFVEFGLGASVVSGFCAMPSGVVARPLGDLPPTTYHLLRRDDGDRHAPRQQLRQHLLAACKAWR
ncbi:MAG: LysR family transcriptional regulator [Polyangiales bacterium]